MLCVYMLVTCEGNEEQGRTHVTIIYCRTFGCAGLTVPGA